MFGHGGSIILNAVEYSIRWHNKTDTLSPGHTVLWLPPHLIQAQPCSFLYTVQPLSCWPSSRSFPLDFYLVRWCLPGSLRSHHMSKPCNIPLLNNFLVCSATLMCVSHSYGISWLLSLVTCGLMHRPTKVFCTYIANY